MVHGRSIFGECVDYTFWDENLYQKVIEEHKFILSFENTYLANYATEKLFSRFNLDIVTVLRDGVIYYTIRGIPSKSYVDADDFVSPKDLADFLMKVRKSKNAYVEYLTNKDRYLSVPINIVQPQHIVICVQNSTMSKKTDDHTMKFQDDSCHNRL